MPQTMPLNPNVPDIEPDYVEPSFPGSKPSVASPRERLFHPDGHDKNASAAETAGVAPPPGGGHRSGECPPNIPDAEPLLVPDSELGRESVPWNADASPETIFPVAGSVLPSWFRVGYFAAGLAAFSLFGLFALGQIANTLAFARTLPVWAAWLLLAPLGFCALLLAAAAIAAGVAWFQLRAVRQVSLAALDALRQREDSRREGILSLQAARTCLERYLEDYPLSGPGAERLLTAGFVPDALEELAGERDYLLARACDSLSWLNDFRDHFQDRMDCMATARIRAWSFKTAVSVIASPLSLLDSVLALYAAFRMLRELALIYNLRCDGAALPFLLGRVLFAAFLAGAAGEAAEAMGESLQEELSSLAGLGLAGRIAPKIGEGTINYLFISRLGRAAMKLLQPVRP
ncbi:MAG: YcjF family protein [Planctomycetota bacterium]|jgi:hypothetical protein|nr:YcjF family protein [Planctomycetota bacterium]